MYVYNYCLFQLFLFDMASTVVLDILAVLVRSLVMILMLVVWSMTIVLSLKVINQEMQIPYCSVLHASARKG